MVDSNHPHPHADYTDEAFVRGVQHDDPAVVQAFYDQCRRQFFIGTSQYALRREDLDDLFQESYLFVWEKITSRQIFASEAQVFAQQSDPLQPERPVPNLIGYFMAVVKNKYLEELRRAGKTNAVALEGVENELGIVYDADPEVTKDRIVNMCVMKLQDSCKEILTMFYYDGLSLNQIAEAREGTHSYDGLKTRKAKCMKFLKERIIRCFKDAGIHVPESDEQPRDKND